MHRPEAGMCLACGRSSMKAGGAETVSWGKGRDEIRDHTDQESHRERSQRALGFLRPQKTRRLDQGLHNFEEKLAVKSISHNLI